MRVLIYFLAMLTGFSSAQAARPVSATPAAVAQGAIVAAAVVPVQKQAALRPLRKSPTLVAVATGSTAPVLAVVIRSPVSKHDLTRQ